MATTRRERQREATSAEIKAVARRQMAADGPASLSLRGIAAEIGMTAPGLYRYFSSRDDLVTALIVDAYQSLGEAIDAAQNAAPRGDYPGRLLAAATAYRCWSLERPADFALIFGTPIPGYHAPQEVTVPVVVAAFRPFVVIPKKRGTQAACTRRATARATPPRPMRISPPNLARMGSPSRPPCFA